MEKVVRQNETHVVTQETVDGQSVERTYGVEEWASKEKTGKGDVEGSRPVLTDGGTAESQTDAPKAEKKGKKSK